MKITVKTTENKVFQVEVEPKYSVRQLKEKIESEQGYPAPDLKVIYAGKILYDYRILEEAGVEDGHFFVLMVPKTTSTQTPNFQAPSSSTTTEQVPSASQGMSESLFGASASPQAANPVQNLFQSFQQQRSPAAGGGASSASPFDAGALGGNNPQIQQLLDGIAQNPAMLQEFIGTVAEKNPTLAKQLESNPNLLLSILGSLGKAGGNEDDTPRVTNNRPEPPTGKPPGGPSMTLTKEEYAAIKRLEPLGFPQEKVIEAYLACDKNEELAANYLFEMS